MRVFAALSLALLAALAFAGCAEDDPGDGATTTSTTSTTSAAATTTSSSTTTTSATTTTTSSPPPNRAPTGSLSAAANGTKVAFSLAGSDPDGDDLSWSLDFGDGSTPATGSALPANVTHDYLVGNYTAELTLSDGTESVEYTVDLAVASAGEVVVLALGVGTYCVFCEDPLGAPAPLPFAASNCFAWQAAGAPAPLPIADCAVAPLDPSAAGLPFTATSDVGDPDVEFYADCTAPEPGTAGIEAFLNGGPEAGVVPAGAGCVVAWLFVMGEVIGGLPNPPGGPPGDIEGGTITVTIG